MRTVAPALRDMRRQDLDEVGAIEASSFSSPWSTASFLSEIEREATWAQVAVGGDGRVMGYVVARLFVDVWHILDLAVAPDCRRQGVARLLMREFLIFVTPTGEEFTLEVRAGNAAAISLYADLGFEVVGRRRGYYNDTGEDALLMTLQAEDRPARCGLPARAGGEA
ncbi:MAG: ribosomal protein S18-alanine N-acetyltransferase [Gaiellales bacterium]|nr:ribosomal protein S18-alanine N-acetyltransferase [Gaiellales bacterium]